MVVTMTPRETWTDERLDDLSQKMDREFDLVRTEVRESRSEMNSRLDAINARMDSMQQTMILGFASIVAAILAAGFL